MPRKVVFNQTALVCGKVGCRKVDLKERKKKEEESPVSVFCSSLSDLCVLNKIWKTHQKKLGWKNSGFGRSWAEPGLFLTLQEFSPVSDAAGLLEGWIVESLSAHLLNEFMKKWTFCLLSLTAFFLNDIHVPPRLRCFPQCQTSVILAAFFSCAFVWISLSYIVIIITLWGIEPSKFVFLHWYY